MKIPPQLIRLLLLTVVIVATYLLGRLLLTPHSFGELGWYRADALPELRAKEISFAGRVACEECHSEIATQISKHEHKLLSCEGCHGAGQAHVDNPDVKMGRATMADCLRCHAADASRPAQHKQIKPREHYSDALCVECHIPHSPNESP